MEKGNQQPQGLGKTGLPVWAKRWLPVLSLFGLVVAGIWGVFTYLYPPQGPTDVQPAKVSAPVKVVKMSATAPAPSPSIKPQPAPVPKALPRKEIVERSTVSTGAITVSGDKSPVFVGSNVGDVTIHD